MHGYATRLVGLGLILGAAVGFALGLILTDPLTAPNFGAVGAGLGIVLGSAVGTRSEAADLRDAHRNLARVRTRRHHR